MGNTPTLAWGETLTVEKRVIGRFPRIGGGIKGWADAFMEICGSQMSQLQNCGFDKKNPPLKSVTTDGGRGLSELNVIPSSIFKI